MLLNNIVPWLVSRKDNVGVMADLKKSLRVGSSHKAWPHITFLCDITNQREEHIVRTLAGLYSHHPQHSPRMGNLGSSLKVLAIRRDPGTFERHIKRIVSVNSIQSITALLPFYVRMLKNEGVPINYQVLLEDLKYFGDKVSKNWCKSFYQGGSDVLDEDNGQ